MIKLYPLILLVTANAAFACSPAHVFEEFQIIEGSGTEPETPNFSVAEISRGYDDGNTYSCSDAGVISLKLNNSPSENIGYIFEHIAGEFEDSLFYSEPIQLTEYFISEGVFHFRWLDGSSRTQEAFNIEVKITAVSRNGLRSTPQILSIRHEGIKSPWWLFW